MNPTLFKEGDSMKKLMIVSIALLAALALAVPALAATNGWETNDATSSVVTLGSGSAGNRPVNSYGLSNNVYLNYQTDTANMNYVIGSVHRSGNRGYGAASSTTLMYYQSKNTGDTSVGGLPAPATDASFASGTWTAGP
jgi:hypothetical protein